MYTCFVRLIFIYYYIYYQRQSSGAVLYNKCSEKLRKIHRITKPVMEFYFLESSRIFIIFHKNYYRDHKISPNNCFCIIQLLNLNGLRRFATSSQMFDKSRFWNSKIKFSQILHFQIPSSFMQLL